LAANVYEGMYILDSNRYVRDSDRMVNQIESMIRKAGGEVLVSRLWEERRLAYPIKGQRKGAYWLIYFRLDSSRINEIKRECQISDGILRTLFLKVDPRIVDAVVAHAQTAVPGGDSGATPPAAVEEPVVDALDDEEVEE